VDHLLEVWQERLDESIHCVTVAPKIQANWEDNLEALEAVHLLWKIKTKYLGHDGSQPMHEHRQEQGQGHAVYR